MKKLITLLCVLLPLSLTAQNKHHFEAGLGLAIPTELLAEKMATKEVNTVSFYGEYRYQFTKAFSAGVNYSFVPNHSGEPVATSSDQVKPDFTIRTRYHSINAVAEYRFETAGPMAFFVGLGGGAQYRYANLSHSIEPRNIWSADVLVRAGLEVYDHLRITAGHIHDLHYPFTAISTGAPYYYFSVGWAF